MESVERNFADLEYESKKHKTPGGRVQSNSFQIFCRLRRGGGKERGSAGHGDHPLARADRLVHQKGRRPMPNGSTPTAPQGS